MEQDTPLSFRIEPATPADKDRITALFFADMVDLGLTPSQTELSRVTSMVFEDDRFRNNTVLRVARRDDGLIIGLVMAQPFLSIKFPGEALWIEELYVVPEYRRFGVGRRLVEDLLTWAESAGYRGVDLEAYRMNTAASILYRSLGFRRLARERYSYAIGEEGA